MSSSVEQIKSKIDIVSLVGAYIKLEKSGANFKGKCPFHNEKTPSFYVSQDRGNYYCFGCHAKGDIFTFVQEFEGLDFLGSLKVLADRAGVVLEHGNKTERTETERLHGVLELATFFFEKNLSENKVAQDYVQNRGITAETVKDFRIGFVPLDWRLLYEFLLSKNVSVKDMLAVGLIKKKEGSVDSYYDTFRGRIMFPISDSSGRVVGFSGRILVSDEKAPKYLNSPETELFKKSEILFGLDKAKKDIRVKDYSILVEGQMDLVLLHQVGLTNTVASSGTALTPEHLIKLRRLSNRIVMAYDGDSAGFSASNRSATLALSLGMELKIVEIPQGKDPADMAVENKEELITRFKGAKHIIDFYTDALIERKLESRELGQEIRIHVLPYIASLGSSIEKAHFMKSLAQKTFIKEDALWEDLKHIGSNGTVPPVHVAKSPPSSRVGSMERKVAGILMWQKSLAAPHIDLVDFERRVEDLLGDSFQKIISHFEKERDVLLFETESYYNNATNISLHIQEIIIGLEEEYLKVQFGESMNLLQKAEQTRDSELVLKYLEECQRISQRINTIKHIHTINEKK